MKLKFKFRFSNAFWVLELNDLPTKSNEISCMMIALVKNEKWPFQFPCCRTLGVHPPLREGWGSGKHFKLLITFSCHAIIWMTFYKYSIKLCNCTTLRNRNKKKKSSNVSPGGCGYKVRSGKSGVVPWADRGYGESYFDLKTRTLTLKNHSYAVSGSSREPSQIQGQVPSQLAGTGTFPNW